jgi:hypothetical protein
MFIVEFCSQSLYTYIVKVAPPDGLEALDAARDALGPQITYVKCPKSGVSRFEVVCDVTESQARQACSASGAFSKSRQATVSVPSQALNRWAQFSWRCLPGNVTIAECVPGLDYKRVVEAWLSDGAPLNWTPSGYEPDANR